MPYKNPEDRAKYQKAYYAQFVKPNQPIKEKKALKINIHNMELLKENPIENYHIQKNNHLSYYEKNDPIDKRMFNEKLQTKHGGAFTPLIFENEIKEDFDDTANVDEEDYDPKNYYHYAFKSYINLSTDEIDKIEEELSDFIDENDKNEFYTEQISKYIKMRLQELEGFTFYDVEPVRKRIIFSILSELKNNGLLRNPNGKVIMKELDNYF